MVPPNHPILPRFSINYKPSILGVFPLFLENTFDFWKIHMEPFDPWFASRSHLVGGVIRSFAQESSASTQWLGRPRWRFWKTTVYANKSDYIYNIYNMMKPPQKSGFDFYGYIPKETKTCTLVYLPYCIYQKHQLNVGTCKYTITWILWDKTFQEKTSILGRYVKRQGRNGADRFPLLDSPAPTPGDQQDWGANVCGTKERAEGGDRLNFMFLS